MRCVIITIKHDPSSIGLIKHDSRPRLSRNNRLDRFPIRALARCLSQTHRKACRAAAYLNPTDRFLIEQVFRHGLPVRSIARQMKKPNENIYRLVGKLVTRVESKPFKFVTGHLPLLPKHLKSTAQLAVLEGLSQRDVAKLTGKSLHQVRRELTMIQGLQAY